jgi:hypothetical protein
MNKKITTQLLGEIADLQAKKNRLEHLMQLAPYRDINIFFYGSDKFLAINQSDMPFNLNIELHMLLTESITHYEHMINNLEYQLKY